MKKIIVCVGITIVLAGCSGAKIKKQIMNDLNGIVQNSDCAVTCELVKSYIASNLNK